MTHKFANGMIPLGISDLFSSRDVLWITQH